MKGSIFNKLQAVGKAFMLPIALLPVAGLFLGIGASFTNPTNIQTYGLQGILGAVENGVVTKPTVLFEILKGKVLPQHLFTIVEEIEQNLFPESQREILINAMNRVNNKLENHLILTTHSPYIIAYTTLAMKAYNVKKLNI